MDPETGKCRWTKEQLEIPVKNLQKYITQRSKGRLFLTERTTSSHRPSAILRTLDGHEARQTPLRRKVGFPDAGGYKTRERKRKLELSEM